MDGTSLDVADEVWIFYATAHDESHVAYMTVFKTKGRRSQSRTNLYMKMNELIMSMYIK